MPTVLAIYEEGLATRNATFETKLPTAKQADHVGAGDGVGRRAPRPGGRLDRRGAGLGP